MPTGANGVDPALVTDVVRQVVGSLQGDLTPADLKLFHEIEELSKYIENARREITELRTEEIRAQHIPAATDELDAIVAATEEATGAILDSAEKIEEVASSLEGETESTLAEAVTRIYEACNFQDITGQRISKVVKTLKHIELKVDNLVQAFGGAAVVAEVVERSAAPLTDEDLLNGPALPAEASKQDEIDALLASFD